jgi:hypothetical protein
VIDWKRKSYVITKCRAVLYVQGSGKENWFDRLPADAFQSASSMRDGRKSFYERVFVTPDGKGTIPLTGESQSRLYYSEREQGKSEDESRSLPGVWHACSCFNYQAYDRSFDAAYPNVNHVRSTYQMLLQAYNPAHSRDYDPQAEVPQFIVCTNSFAGEKMTVRNDKLYLPKVFKFINLDDKVSDLALATENDVVRLLFHNRKKLKITKTANSLYVLDDVSVNRTEAFRGLVENYGFRAKIANEILASADLVKQTLTIPYIPPRYKQADLPIDPVQRRDGYLPGMESNVLSPVFNDPYRSSDPYSGLPIQSGLSEAQQLGYEDVPPPIEMTADAPPPPDPMAMQQAAQAAQTGQKDVFDVSVLAGLLNTDRNDTLLSDYTKLFRKALDRLCRLLFKYYWDKESYLERFGQDHIEQFEETLKDCIDTLGDLTLFLSERDERPSIADFLGGISLEEGMAD